MTFLDQHGTMGVSQSSKPLLQAKPSVYPSVLTKLDDLPAEFLACIMLFLPARDKVTLQFISQRIQSVSETCSPWCSPITTLVMKVM